MNKETNIPLEYNKAFEIMLHRLPFWAVLAMRLTPVVDNTQKTGWTDGVSLGFNENWFKDLPMDERVGFIAHEVGHCVLLHHTRRNGRDPETWNIAADYALNQILAESGIKLPEGALKCEGMTAKYKGMTAEDIYMRLNKKNKQNNQNKSGQGQGEPQSGQGKQQPGQGQPQAQSGQGHAPQSQEEKAAEFGEVRDMPTSATKQGAGEKEKAEADWKKAAASARATAAKRQGEGAIGAAREIEAHQAKEDWKAIVARFSGELTKTEDNWKKPSRRVDMVKLQRNAGIFLPSSSTTQLPKLLIAVDTSGSIGKGELSRITGEIAACADEAASKEPETIKIIWFDSNIAGEEFYEHGKTLSPKGGGGTNYAPVMEYANSEEGGGYNGLIIITDGYCNKFGTEPPMACLWILTRKNDSFKPPFGEVIRFSE